ncbi:MAG: hypothetical protein ACLFMX_01025 [Halobacteriales archaeon]
MTDHQLTRRRLLATALAVAAGTAGCLDDDGTTATPDAERAVEAIVFNTAEYPVELDAGDRVVVELRHVRGHSTFAHLRAPGGGADVLEVAETDAATTMVHEANETGTYRVFVSSGGQSDVTIRVERRPD